MSESIAFMITSLRSAKERLQSKGGSSEDYTALTDAYDSFNTFLDQYLIYLKKHTSSELEVLHKKIETLIKNIDKPSLSRYFVAKNNFGEDIILVPVYIKNWIKQTIKDVDSLQTKQDADFGAIVNRLVQFSNTLQQDRQSVQNPHTSNRGTSQTSTSQSHRGSESQQHVHTPDQIKAKSSIEAQSQSLQSPKASDSHRSSSEHSSREGRSRETESQASPSSLSSPTSHSSSARTESRSSDKTTVDTMADFKGPGPAPGPAPGQGAGQRYAVGHAAEFRAEENKARAEERDHEKEKEKNRQRLADEQREKEKHRERENESQYRISQHQRQDEKRRSEKESHRTEQGHEHRHEQRPVVGTLAEKLAFVQKENQSPSSLHSSSIREYHSVKEINTDTHEFGSHISTALKKHEQHQMQAFHDLLESFEADITQITHTHSQAIEDMRKDHELQLQKEKNRSKDLTGQLRQTTDELEKLREKMGALERERTDLIRQRDLAQSEATSERRTRRNQATDLENLEATLDETLQKHKTLEHDLRRLTAELAASRVQTSEAQKAGRSYGDYWREQAFSGQISARSDQAQGKDKVSFGSSPPRP